MIQEALLLDKSRIFNELACGHEVTGRNCDLIGLPPEYGDYERGRAAAYRICSDALKSIATTTPPNRISTQETCEQFNARMAPLKEAYWAMSAAHKKMFPHEP